MVTQIFEPVHWIKLGQTSQHEMPIEAFKIGLKNIAVLQKADSFIPVLASASKWCYFEDRMKIETAKWKDIF